MFHSQCRCQPTPTQPISCNWICCGRSCCCFCSDIHASLQCSPWSQGSYFSAPCVPSPFVSLFLLVVAHIWGHVAGSSPPSPLRFVPFRLFMRRLQLFRPSSTHSRRIVPTRATRSINGPLSFSFCNWNQNLTTAIFELHRTNTI